MYIKITVILNFLIFAFIGVIVFIGRNCSSEGCIIFAELISIAMLVGIVSVICTGYKLIRTYRTSNIPLTYSYLFTLIVVIYLIFLLIQFIH